MVYLLFMEMNDIEDKDGVSYIHLDERINKEILESNIQFMNYYGKEKMMIIPKPEEIAKRFNMVQYENPIKNDSKSEDENIGT